MYWKTVVCIWQAENLWLVVGLLLLYSFISVIQQQQEKTTQPFPIKIDSNLCWRCNFFIIHCPLQKIRKEWCCLCDSRCYWCCCLFVVCLLLLLLLPLTVLYYAKMKIKEGDVKFVIKILSLIVFFSVNWSRVLLLIYFHNIISLFIYLIN